MPEPTPERNDQIEIDETWLQGLNDTEVTFAGEYLEQLFLKSQRTFAPLSPNEINTISALFKAVPTVIMKEALIAYLPHKSKEAICHLLDDEDQLTVLTFHHDRPFLHTLFKSFTSKNQDLYLKIFYDTDRGLYNEYKPFKKQETILDGDIKITKKQLLPKEINNYLEDILNHIFDPKKTKQQILKDYESLEKHLELENLEQLTYSLLTLFIQQQYPMTNSNDFLSYLKFFLFIEHPLFLFSTLNTHLQPLLEHIIHNLSQLPSDEWVLKVLDQFPIYIIEHIIQLLKSYPSIKNQALRNRYLKYNNLIQKEGNNMAYPQLRFILNKT